MGLDMAQFDWQTELVEVTFPLVELHGVLQSADNFLKVKETLTRIGAPGYDYDTDDRENRILWQSCHILHKRQRFFIVHFKEMHLLDGKFNQTNLTENDLARRNAIALLLREWKLIDIVDLNKVHRPKPAPVNTIRIIPFSEKGSWILKSKYSIGAKSNRY